jgi:UDP-N-acetylglucosamine transferase subunit ALG13
MIFISLGTNKNPFPRLLQEVENLIKTVYIRDEVLVQQGNTVYISNLFKSFRSVAMTEFIEYIQKADIVIIHAGSGTLFNAIKSGKKVIAVARLKKYGEHTDDHQLELARKLSEEGYILDGTYSLIDAWKKLESFTPRPFDFSNQIVSSLKKYIDSCEVK